MTDYSIQTDLQQSATHTLTVLIFSVLGILDIKGVDFTRISIEFIKEWGFSRTFFLQMYMLLQFKHRMSVLAS